MYLTVKEVAVLQKCSERYIKRQIQDGKIKAKETINDKKRKKYLVPIKSLDEKLQIKYYSSLREKSEFDFADDFEKKLDFLQGNNPYKKPLRDISELTDSEADQISLWMGIIKRWQDTRAKFPDDPKKADELAINAINAKLKEKGHKERVNIQKIYRRYKYYKNGEYTGMLDDRGKIKSKESIDERVWQAFLYYYLDDRQPSMCETYKDVLEWTRIFYPELVDDFKSLATFRRRYKREIPDVVGTMLRKGSKAMSDKCLDYVERIYEDIMANDCWVADNHTLDIITKYDDGTDRTHRLSFTAFMDAKSGVITGWNITDNPCSQSTVFALRMGIEKYGVPKSILFDNGREFTVKDVGGKGHRKRKSDEWHEVPPTILELLGIEARWAQVKNAKAKHIERFFLNFKNNISKKFETYAGGNILERPESLKKRIKKGEVITDSEIRGLMDTFITYENSKEYGGAEKRKYRGFSKQEVWNEEISHTTQRVVSEDMLEKMLMRTSTFQKVGRKGVYLNIAGTKVYYSELDSVFSLGKEVYLRYDPRDLSKVKLYDKEDRYYATWRVERDLLLHFLDASKEDVAEANAKLAQQKKIVRDFAKGLTAGLSPETKIDQLALSIERATEGIKGIEIKKGKVIEPVSFLDIDDKEDELEMTGTDGDSKVVKFDLDRMIRNAEKRRQEERGY